MSDDLHNVLHSLRDVDGVVGSFVIDGEGALDARALPDNIDPRALLAVGPRIERLYEAWRSSGSELDSASLSFAEHKLHLRELPAGYLAVVSSAQVNAPALRMAMGMVGRRVSALLEARTAAPDDTAPALRGGATSTRPAETRPSTAPPAPDGRHSRPSHPQPEGDGPKPRMYRGSIVR